MKRWISRLLCVCLLAGMLLPASAAVDTDSASARSLAELGLFRGTGKGFALEETVTRAQAVTMIVRFLGAEEEALEDATPSGFEDTESHWAERYVSYARRHGITEGTSAGTFSPEAPVTGQQITKLILSAVGYSGITLENAASCGEKAELLTDNELKAAARGTTPLTRRTLADFFCSALFAKNADGERICRTLIDRGIFTEEEFHAVMMIQDEETSFSGRLLDALESDTENVTISPLSVKLALAMAANGATGETRTQMLRVLGIEDLEDFNREAKELLAAAEDSGVLSVANALALNEDAAGESVTVNRSFEKLLSDSYSAKFLRKPGREIVKAVNDWVASKTNNRIRNLISSSDFLACLVNAVYFKAEWSIPFNAYATQEGSFANADGTKSTVQLMHMTQHLDYYEDESCQIIRLPYVGGEYSMLVALGDCAGSPAEYADRLTDRRVAVTLPRFEIEYSVSLKKELSELGMTRCFTGAAELDGMIDGESVCISDVIHKTYLHVTETGTEAAAATAAMVAATAFIVEDEPVEFTADRPFSWCIVHNESGEVLFCGTVNTLGQ